MGTTLASALIAQAHTIQEDAAATRWPDAEHLDWLNAGSREIAVFVADANTVIANIDLVAGSKQTLPAGALSLKRLIRNMGAGGATPGEAPRPSSMREMDSVAPNWHSTAPATLVVKNWMYDPMEPLTYYVYPPMSGATKVEAAYPAYPTAVASVGTAITLPDRFAGALLDYMLYRAFLKDTDIPGMAARAQFHLGQFNTAIGRGTAATIADAEAP